MKIINLMGGLGNQMFQYAFGLALAKKNKELVLYDKIWFENFYSHRVASRVFELGNFKADVNIASEEDKRLCMSQRTIDENISKGTDYHLNILGNAYLIGYFQNEDYIKDIREDVLEAFSLKTPLSQENLDVLEQIKSSNSVSLHIRRGDYVNLGWEFSDLTYYKNAIDYIAQRVENPVFFIFSDDIDWVADNLNIEYPAGLVDINNNTQGFYDLELMKNCKHNIIANSTFSWWGAWLNENPDKIVTSPDPWLLNSDSEDISCRNWVKIKR